MAAKRAAKKTTAKKPSPRAKGMVKKAIPLIRVIKKVLLKLVIPKANI